jgi:secreted trypsin-like serine protease
MIFFNEIQGDSGSGVTMTLNGRPTIVGIVSFGVRKCEAGFPPSFTRVTSYLSWIYTNTDIRIHP